MELRGLTTYMRSLTMQTTLLMPTTLMRLRHCPLCAHRHGGHCPLRPHCHPHRRRRRYRISSQPPPTLPPRSPPQCAASASVGVVEGRQMSSTSVLMKVAMRMAVRKRTNSPRLCHPLPPPPLPPSAGAAGVEGRRTAKGFTIAPMTIPIPPPCPLPPHPPPPPPLPQCPPTLQLRQPRPPPPLLPLLLRDLGARAGNVGNAMIPARSEPKVSTVLGVRVVPPSWTTMPAMTASSLGL